METIKLTREEQFLQGLDQFGCEITSTNQLQLAYQAVCEAIYANYGDNAVHIINERINPHFSKLLRQITLEPKQDRTGEVRKLINFFREA